jgi:ABC-type branched-subunit amino acid transport system substrate-binding protein
MCRKLVRIALLGLCVFSVTACATFGERAASPEERTAFDAARVQVQDDPGAGVRAIEAFIAQFPEGPLVDDAHYELARIAHRGGKADAAVRQYRFIIERFSGNLTADLSRVRVAEIERDRGNLEEARRMLGRLRVSRLPEAEAREAYRVLSDVATDPVLQVRWLSVLRNTVGQREVDAVDVEIDAKLAKFELEALERLASQLGGRPPAGRVEVARAELALEAGDLDAAESYLDRAANFSMVPRYEQRMHSMRDRLRLREEGPTNVRQLPTFADVLRRGLPSSEGARGAIGVVLPLSGPFARFGEASLRGVLLAAGVFGDEPGSPALRVVVRDSQGRPDVAAAAVRELAEDEGVLAIVGPLLSAECEAAAAAAQDAQIPLLALTSREEVARDRSHVFRLRTRNIEDIQLLVDHATSNGASRFAILYRDDAYGRGMRSLFWDAVEAADGRVVGVSSYDPKATDFGQAIRRLVGYVLLTDEEKGQLARREKMLHKARYVPAEEALALRQQARELTRKDGGPLPPIVDFDALFVPDSADKMVLIAPQLVFHEVRNTQLLGPDGWYDAELVRVAGDHIEGAVFASHFYAESPVGYVRSFAKRYADAFEETPDTFSAVAYDAARLITVQIARGAILRDDVRDGVLDMDEYPGVSGVLAMRADGNAHKRPFLLGVEGGRVVQYQD